MPSTDKPDYPEQRCCDYKYSHGIYLRCSRPLHHSQRHAWAVDTGFYPMGRLDPDDPLDQAFVRAWNKGAAKAEERRAQ